MIERKDPAVTWGYSLPQSKHEALKAIAKHEARKKATRINATRILDEIVEEYLQKEFGRQWRQTYEQALALDEELIA